MRRSLLLSLAAAAAAAVWFSGCTTMARRASDDAREKDASLWLHSPHVAAGDTLHLEIGVFDDPAVGITRAEIFIDGDLVLTTSGRGIHWASSIYTSDKSFIWEDSDFISVSVPVPKDAEGSIDLRVAVHYVGVLALQSKFMNLDQDVSMSLSIPIRSPVMRTVRRMLSGLLGLGALLGVWLALRWKWAPISTWAADDNWSLIVALSVLWAGVGYWWFAERLAIATGVLAIWFRISAMVLWLVLPPLAAALTARRAERIPRAELL